ncbi:MAG: hypothetical protein A2312_03180 [Candidatus Staskawiczbacteria bacterium RIFOXYB2_FULL_32_9]|uniref:Xylose isomerase-like TIM barrel domain-containing protein n=1 Tax=Candidatus Staskawiczbacteria bacterium RIFOXYD1_FULL_32_13 TaxID=1802234 RepID=A0A1G2JNF3_9BACT|nr:MAG: hypothetical protein UR22_C0005G0025 [Parcubacteria group bacterium GW2011_GWC2_32_10]OGZ79677.1 MAG: hypothetical protein A2360_01990 [Candidatus Staskawiczbacteria bacterium RIFOXYB1_FULL_32_11]OGZ81145.1 MAG: hypothetical protein A2312_03180 [Candidatus Staskawiczbacteria bacterium RIFOXYB2_FULL_32_9]OGZ85507.1 MAG: hypothetical protein A2463_02415 [Candidatus Staskawiczbacteria bacterium RIFOXYC2_FULL_32_10]OGZ88639.1 MAG: hypothetical protein A2561_02220 [Candidatus Staskawiczbacte
MKIDFNKRILVSITGKEEKDWQNKLNEINKLKIKEVALFLELYNKEEKQKIYHALLNSCIKSIPLVHLRHDMDKEELIFLKKNFKTKYFTIHEINFQHNDILKWKGFYKNITLEMNYDNFVSGKVKVKNIDGFCIDLAHFKAGMERLNKDFNFVYNRKKIIKYFDCNHLNGYNPDTQKDMHTIYSLKDFDYLKTLPNFVFGKIIALETFNSIKEQLKFKEYLIKLLNNKFNYDKKN